jgi:hypothetical protein
MGGRKGVTYVASSTVTTIRIASRLWFIWRSKVSTMVESRIERGVEGYEGQERRMCMWHRYEQENLTVFLKFPQSSQFYSQDHVLQIMSPEYPAYADIGLKDDRDRDREMENIPSSLRTQYGVTRNITQTLRLCEISILHLTQQPAFRRLQIPTRDI